MGLKILGGVAKGFSLTLPLSDELRPTSVLLRRKIFDAHQDMGGVLFIDLFAGSGAVGMEALSRGANFAFFIERHKKVHETLKKNLEQLARHYPESFTSYQTICQDGAKWPKVAAERLWQKWLEGEVDEVVVFLDPPYEKSALYEKALRNLEDSFAGEGADFLSHTRVWLEGDEKKGRSQKEWEKKLQESFPLWRVVKTYSQGSHYAIVLAYQVDS